MSDESLSSSLSSGNLVENNYKLALKFFMNKNFEKSYEILRAQYKLVFKQYRSGVINDSLFIKIVNLYLTEVGLILQSNHEFKVSKPEKQLLVNDLKQDIILSDLLEVYEDFDRFPLEVLYNLYLINYIGLELSLVHQKFMKVYGKLDFYNSDPSEQKFLRKLLELLALKVLPELSLLEDSKQLVKENPLFQDKQFYMDKIEKLESDKRKHQEHQQHLKQKQVREQAQRDNEEKKNKDLKYKSLKQIKEANGQPDTPRSSSRSNSTDLNALRDKLLYNLRLTKKWLHQNSPLLLLAIVILFIISRVLKTRNVSVMKNLKETLGMAFKISYL